MVFGLALIIIPPIVCGLFFYFLIKIWQEEDEKLEQTEKTYENLSDGVYMGKLDVNLGVGITRASNTFRFKIRKGKLYNIEKIKDRDGYFAVEVTEDFYIILNGDQVNEYFEEMR